MPSVALCIEAHLPVARIQLVLPCLSAVSRKSTCMMHDLNLIIEEKALGEFNFRQAAAVV